MIKKPNKKLWRPNKNKKRLNIRKNTTNSMAHTIMLTEAEYSPTEQKSEESTPSRGILTLSMTHLKCVVSSEVLMMIALRKKKPRKMKRKLTMPTLSQKNKVKKQLLQKLSRKLNLKESSTHLMGKCMKMTVDRTTLVTVSKLVV